MTELHLLIRTDARRPIAAYTLNGQHPVKCSIISEDPLFYFDFDDGGEAA